MNGFGSDPDCLDEVFKISNGYLLRFYVKSINGQFQINLEQLKYISLLKEFELYNQDSLPIQLKLCKQLPKSTSKKNTKSVVTKFIQTNQNYNAIALHITIQIDPSTNTDSYSYVILCTYAEKQAQFKFNRPLTNSINNYLKSSTTTSAIFPIGNLHIKLNSKLNKFLMLQIRKDETSHTLELVLTNETATSMVVIPLINEPLVKIEKFEIVKTTHLENQFGIDDEDDDYIDILKSNIMIFVKYEYENFVKMCPIFIDIETNRAFKIECEQFLGSLFQQFNKSDSRLIDLGGDSHVDFSNSLDRAFFTQLDKPKIDSSLDLNILKIQIKDYRLSLRNGHMSLSGDCFVVIGINGKSSILINLSMGSVVFKQNLENCIYEYLNFEENKNTDEIYLIGKKINSNMFNIYQLDGGGNMYRLVEENIEAQLISRVIFLTEQEPKYQYFYLYDWKSVNFEMRESILRKEEFNNRSFDFELGQQIDELDTFSSEHLVQKNSENELPLLEQNKICALNNIIKILESKMRSADLILNEAMVEVKRKYSLISELTSIYSFNKCNNVDMLNRFLPKLIEFYKSEINLKVENKTENRNKLNNLSESRAVFKFELSWTCYLNDCFSLNFIFLNQSRKCLSNLNCVVLINECSNKFSDLQYKQKLLQIKPEMFDKLLQEIKNPNLNSLGQLSDLDFEKLIDTHMLGDENSCVDPIEPTNCVLITLEFSSEQYKLLFVKFPNGCFTMNLHLNSTPEKEGTNKFELYKQDVPVCFDIYENLIQMSKFNLKMYLTMLNCYRNCSMSNVKLKCKNSNIELLIRHLKENLEFECVFKNKTNHIFYLSKQSLLASTIVILKNDLNCGLTLSIISSTPQHVNTLICLINKSLKAESSDIHLEIDLSLIIDKLIDCLNKEINYHLDMIQKQTDKNELHMEVDSHETEKNENEELNKINDNSKMILSLEEQTDLLFSKLIN